MNFGRKPTELAIQFLLCITQILLIINNKKKNTTTTKYNNNNHTNKRTNH